MVVCREGTRIPTVSARLCGRRAPRGSRDYQESIVGRNQSSPVVRAGGRREEVDRTDRQGVRGRGGGRVLAHEILDVRKLAVRGVDGPSEIVGFRLSNLCVLVTIRGFQPF